MSRITTLVACLALVLTTAPALGQSSGLQEYSPADFLRDYGRAQPDGTLYIRDEDGTRLLIDLLTGAIAETLPGLGAARAVTPEQAGIRVPPGHLPPAGQCRVWVPGRPPGQQAPAGSCNVAVPEGAYLIRR